MDKLREQTLALLKSPPIKLRGKPNPAGEVNLERLSDLIHNLYKEWLLSEIDKLTVIDDEGIVKKVGRLGGVEGNANRE